MTRQIYHRDTGRLHDDVTYKDGQVDFLYQHPLGRLLLNLVVSKPWFSRFYTRRDYQPRSVEKIPAFIDACGIDMADYPQQTYESFNDFFTRPMLLGKRPIAQGAADFIAPADAKLRVYPVSEALEIAIKGCRYTLPELLRKPEAAAAFQNGLCLVFRLGVEDYHRYCFVDDGQVDDCWEIPGRLHTVREASAHKWVFCENHRICTMLSMTALGKALMIEVGALLVGKIHNHPVANFVRGQEKGYFAYGGSTILLLLEQGKVIVDPDIWQCSRQEIEVKVRQGERIGTIRPAQGVAEDE